MTQKTKRTCASCVAFHPSANDDEPTCDNLVHIRHHHVDAQGQPIVIYQQPYAAFRCDSHQTHEEEAAQDHDAEVAQQLAEASPEFMAAMSACLRLEESLGMDHPDTTRALQRAMMLSPPSMMDFMGREAQAMGLIPEADGYTEDGAPVFSLESVAAKLDMSMEDAAAAFNSMLTERTELGLPNVLVDPDHIHRKQ